MLRISTQKMSTARTFSKGQGLWEGEWAGVLQARFYRRSFHEKLLKAFFFKQESRIVN